MRQQTKCILVSEISCYGGLDIFFFLEDDDSHYII
jgi:hypothetical protein